MTKLDCNVVNCMYNADKKCSKNDILVEEVCADDVAATIVHDR